MNHGSSRSHPAGPAAWRTSRGFLSLASAALAFWLLACGSKSKGAEEPVQEPGGDQTPKVDPTLCDVDDKRVATFDLNRDGRPDVWKLYQTIQEGDTDLEILSCKQVDLDHDGRKDYVVAYNRKGGTTFEKFDFDFDGRFDALFLFDGKTGRVVEVQRDSDFDGRYDLLEVYDEDEVVTAIKRDRNADGAPDLWEQYVEGELVAILYDDDYDNKVDRREEVDVDESGDGEATSDEGHAGDEDTAGSGDDPAGDQAGEPSQGDGEDGGDDAVPAP